MSSWNFADVFETITDQIGDGLAQRHDNRSYTWAEFNARANGVAAALLEAGLSEQDAVALYLYNAPEYLETMYACFKAGFAPVNTNYRYGAEELVYLWDNADASAVVFHGSFTNTIASIRDRLPKVSTWLFVDDGANDCPPWATRYEPLAVVGTSGAVTAPWGRSADHLVLLYTGGTTGMPKGVMWRQGDLFGALDATNRHPLPAEQDLDLVAERVTKPGPRNLPGAPLMHGTGMFNALSNLMIGGSVTTLRGRKFDVVELLDTIEQHHINSISIVGDAFAQPILNALDAEPDRWDISSLRVIVSSGVMWSKATKEGLLRHNERLILVDTLGSSEAIGVGASTTRNDGDSMLGGDTARFTIGDRTRVITDDGRDVEPGSGDVGRIALRGYTPIGYYKDPDKSAGTFQMIDGERYSIPGDFAEVLADGSVKLLGRGSQCINTGGEKVYPEEVEECLKTHPAVADAAVVGLADERFGQSITALVEFATDRSAQPDELIDHVKTRLARYKAPKTILPVESVNRAVNGKLDYRRLTDLARDLVD